ncbi:MAG: WecB/TagA/CpsF family glycosyltransferase [Mesorhizobium sp.]
MNARPPMPFETMRPTMDILGVTVLSVGWAQATEILSLSILERRYTPVSFLNAHNANVACSDEGFRKALEHFLILPDGIGVDIAAKWTYGTPFPANLNGTDFVPALIASIKTPLKVGLLGATRENAGGAAEQLSALAPQHSYEVIHDGFFKPHEEAGILERMKAVRPDILLVAMGVPRQEFWIDRNLTGEHCTMPIAVGALLDFLSGKVPRAPAWVRRLRLEWVYRLWIEPGRLWRRYIIGNPLFIARVLASRFAGGRTKSRP